MTVPLIVHNIEQLEKQLWSAADDLRANSKLTSSEYCMPVLGLIFLRHASNRHDEALKQIKADQAAGKMAARPLVAADFIKRRALPLPPEAHYAAIANLPADVNKGKAIVAAMDAIERDFEALRGQLPKDYEKFDNDLLGNMLRVFDSETLRTATGDVFGRIYEYFLMKFAMQGAQDNGEFFTPPSLVQLIVNVIEPDHGIVFDPACGSGGMFVQSSHFIEQSGQDTAHRVTFFGQEKTATTIRLAKMNLAVHGLEGDIKEANTFYQDEHSLFGKCDFVMANPPFNVDMVDSEKIKGDRRLPFGLPGVNKAKKVSNGNYLWISYFHSYLNEKGRAGFVMSSQASSAGNAEAEVRRKLVETGDVDVMIAIRSNFFYTRTVPCELWHFDRNKPAERRDQILMIDARNIYRKVTRKIYDFSPEQQQNLAAIVWLYRGQSDRFVGLVRQYLDRVVFEAAKVPAAAAAFRSAWEAWQATVQPFVHTQAEGSAVATQFAAAAAARDAVLADIAAWQSHFTVDFKSPPEATLDTQKQRVQELDPVRTSCGEIVARLNEATKVASQTVEAAEAARAKDHDEWDARKVRRLEAELASAREALSEQLEVVGYFHDQAAWLLARFPDAKFISVPGLCAVVGREHLAKTDYALTPGRIVGVSPREADASTDVGAQLKDIRAELSELNAEAVQLASAIDHVLEALVR